MCHGKDKFTFLITLVVDECPALALNQFSGGDGGAVVCDVDDEDTVLLRDAERMRCILRRLDEPDEYCGLLELKGVAELWIGEFLVIIGAVESGNRI